MRFGSAMLRRGPPPASPSAGPPDAGSVLAALATPVLVVDEATTIQFANSAAEQFFQLGASMLRGQPLAELLNADSPVLGLVDAARRQDASISESGVPVEHPRLGKHLVSVHTAPIPERRGHVAISIVEMSLAFKLDRQINHRHAARSVSAMAAMLAHEVKNPLSGIRGAAQLLEATAQPEDQELARLICDETDRICVLLDRMDVFSDTHPLPREAVNIHEVLKRVRKLAQSGFARHVRFIDDYDPSLPPVLGNRDRLVQLFLNLVKNAAEAVPLTDGEITLSTAYQHGIKLAFTGSEARINLPLVVSVQDNGPGIPEEMRADLFDAFVTTKHKGTGLGLAVVAKIVGDHGGMIEFESANRRTVFRVFLPVATAAEAAEAAALEPFAEGPLE